MTCLCLIKRGKVIAIGTVGVRGFVQVVIIWLKNYGFSCVECRDIYHIVQLIMMKKYQNKDNKD